MEQKEIIELKQKLTYYTDLIVKIERQINSNYQRLGHLIYSYEMGDVLRNQNTINIACENIARQQGYLSTIKSKYEGIARKIYGR